ncbi:sugar transferase [Soonwooa sp.]|uniref:sugar transferase n=1 Tax=Soonwooa sp. TaxID=1938592 RepID=UPI00262F7656|nr:sugar transferase [Soonwooa sp.]
MSFYKYFKICYDWFVALVLLLVLWPLLLVLIFVSAFDTASNGLFIQERVGQYGRLFNIYKIRSIHRFSNKQSQFGEFLRKSKLDELPQLINILKLEMSFVGPRPDIPGYYDKLNGENSKVLELKPGITSEASIKYRNEESMLREQENPLKYNDEVLFPDKVKLNLKYYYEMSLATDFRIMLKTVFKI